MNEQINKLVIEDKKTFSFKNLLTLIVLNWYWILGSVFAFTILANIYLWFEPSTLSVYGTMELIDRSNKGGSSVSIGRSMLNALPMNMGSLFGGGGGSDIDSEQEILKASALARSVVKELNLQTEYSMKSLGRKTLLYQTQPINVALDTVHMEWLDDELPLTFHQILLTIKKGDEGITVEPILKEGKDETELPAQTFSTLPARLQTDYGTLTLTENTLLTDKQRKTYEGNYSLNVKISPSKIVADEFAGRLKVEPPTKKVVNMLSLKVKDENLMRGIDYIDHLVKAYNQRANDLKDEEARKTDEFVSVRLAKLDAELGTSDASWEGSKKNFQIINPETDASDVLEKKGNYELQLVEIGTQIQLHDYLSEYINDPANLFEIIPASIANTGASTSAMGISGGGGSSMSGASDVTSQAYVGLISQHNELVNRRKDYLKSMSEQSPQIQRITESIRELHPTLQLAMKRDRQNLVLRRKNLEREYEKYQGRMSSAPRMERVLTEIGRQREIKQGVYLLMLQKREETAMELANTPDKGRLIDDIKVVPGSNSPKKGIVYFAALFLGFVLPVVVLYLKQLLKPNIETLDELGSLTKLPILGVIPLNDNGEAIRSLRSTLLYKLKEGKKVVLIASDLDGDGKTYLAERLAESFTVIGKKAQYMNFDMRSVPQTGIHPADYLASEDFARKLAAAKANNDYLFLDSPSISRFSDAYQVAEQADITLYVVKSGTTPKTMVKSFDAEVRFPQPMFVLNAVDLSKKKFKHLV